MPLSRSTLALLLLGACAISCRTTPLDSAAIRVTVKVRTAVDCVRVVASDEKKGPPSSVELAVDVLPGGERTLEIAVYRREEWGRNARVVAEGLKGGCAGLAVSRSAPEVAAFGEKERIPNVVLVLAGVDEDRDGYVTTLPDGEPFDCDDADLAVHPEAAEACDVARDLDCDSKRGCQRAACVGARDSDGKRCCPGGVAPDAEATCHDGKDDDCDGLTDCADQDCKDLQCDLFGRTCAALGVCACASGKVLESACGDRLDEDCDGLVDCADPDCGALSCTAGGRCIGKSCCLVGADGGASAGAEQCADLIDNDCNQLTDCQDLACAGQSAGAGQVCCASTGTSVPSTEVDCQNGKDDDCDGLTDCDDPNCNGRSCLFAGAGGVCSAFLCRSENCKNQLDDNGDGKVDCADPLCAAKACNDHGRVCGALAKCECNGSSTVVEGLVAGQCQNGLDDDCDGSKDCSDTSCSGQTCQAGKLCQAGACVCALSEAAEVSCGDGADNDCDGTADCLDGDCAGRLCTGSGKLCQASACVCLGGTETSCVNGADDNCDGKADCADPTCLGKSCSASGLGRTCQAAGTCGCATGNTEFSCINGSDDNCDGLIDCADGLACASGASCSLTGRTCQSGACVCPYGQVTETSCGDGVDNDCDGQGDCLDADCNGQVCKPFGDRCAGTSCACAGAIESCEVPGDEDCNGKSDCADPFCAAKLCGSNGLRCSINQSCMCPSGQTREITCADGADNDCDGLSDCADPDCLGSQCGAGQRFCCEVSATGCAVATSAGACGYCTFTCASGQSCNPAAPTGGANCSCTLGGTDCLPGNHCLATASGNYCVECLGDLDCPSGRPRCSQNNNTCYCPPSDGGVSCVPQCTASAGCGGATPICNVGLGRCVRCLANAHCPLGTTCVNFSCQ